MASSLIFDRFQEEPGRISSARIAAIASVIVVHLVAFGLLLLPTSAGIPVVRSVAKNIEVIWIKPEKKVVPVVDQKPDTTPKPVVAQAPKRPAPIVSRPDPVVVQEARAVDTSASLPDTTSTLPPSGMGEMSEAVEATQPDGVVVLVSPRPPYPREALLGHIQGTVVLKIVVNGAGLPEAVSVERSSGSRDLDRAASSHVKRTWKFQGTGATQTALLPIDFKLD